MSWIAYYFNRKIAEHSWMACAHRSQCSVCNCSTDNCSHEGIKRPPLKWSTAECDSEQKKQKVKSAKAA